LEIINNENTRKHKTLFSDGRPLEKEISLFLNVALEAVSSIVMATL
jgi:hypothetical protein